MGIYPAPYIQNHVNWCWATAAKIIACHYHAIKGLSYKMPSLGYVPRGDKRGLRAQYIGLQDGVALVDFCQAAIVDAACDKERNSDGNAPEDDQGKCRAIRYALTGDPFSLSVEVVTIGSYYTTNLLHELDGLIPNLLTHPTCMIGNYQRKTGDYHSVVLRTDKKGITIYDPWDGFTGHFTVEQTFSTGFLLSTGPGIVRWAQYIR